MWAGCQVSGPRWPAGRFVRNGQVSGPRPVWSREYSTLLVIAPGDDCPSVSAPCTWWSTCLLPRHFLHRSTIYYQGCSWTKLEFLVYKGLIRVVGHGNPRLAMGTHGYPPFLLRKWVGERGYPWAPTIFSCDELCAIWELGVSGHGLPRVSVWR